MSKVIIYDEAYEIFNVEGLLSEDVQVVGYLKSDLEYFKGESSGKSLYGFNDLERLNSDKSFDYIIVNSKKYGLIYEKVIELNINPNCLIDVSFFFYDKVRNSLKGKFSYCVREENLNFNMIFLGRSNINDDLFSKEFKDYISVCNMFSDIHYDYHLLYYLIKNNKIGKSCKIGMFINYSMLYDNVDLKEDRFGFTQLFEEYFRVHNNEKRNALFSRYCFESFKENSKKLFKIFNTDLVKCDEGLNIGKLDLKDIKHMCDQETISYRECSTISFRMNRNILNQYVKLVRDNLLDLFFIIPPVHKMYRTYINKTLQNEFYMVLNKYIDRDICIFDYFDRDFNDSYFSSPTTLTRDGIMEFLKVLNSDINNKYLNIRLCNNL